MKEIITKTEHIKVCDSGIVVCTVNQSAYMELEDGIENLNAIRKISNGVRVPVLVDIISSKEIVIEPFVGFGKILMMELGTSTKLTLVGITLILRPTGRWSEMLLS